MRFWILVIEDRIRRFARRMMGKPEFDEAEVARGLLEMSREFEADRVCMRQKLLDGGMSPEETARMEAEIRKQHQLAELCGFLASLLQQQPQDQEA